MLENPPFSAFSIIPKFHNKLQGMIGNIFFINFIHLFYLFWTATKKYEFSFLSFNQSIYLFPTPGQFINVLAEVHTPSDKLKIRVFDSKGITIYNMSTETERYMKFAFTTEDAGNIQFCFNNDDEKEIKFKFKFVTGVEAKDYSELMNKGDFQQVRVQLSKMQDMIETIKREMRFLIMKESHRISNVEDISYKILGFSLISLGLITLLTVF